MEKAKKERAKSGAVGEKSTMLGASVVWSAYAWNTTAEEAAKQVVTDLFEHLSRGGSVVVQVEESDGTARTLEVTAESR